jgi:hypothetical protein
VGGAEEAIPAKGEQDGRNHNPDHVMGKCVLYKMQNYEHDGDSRGVAEGNGQQRFDDGCPAFFLQS